MCDIPGVKTKNYFETLAEAIDEAYGRALAESAEFDGAETDEFLARFNGGVKYGETRRETLRVFKYRGRLCYSKALTVVIYRLESGRYELTSYLA